MILGLTGNIASGKSSVAREFARLGAVIVDADQLAREVVGRGSETLATLVATFGAQILRGDGTMDRERLGELIFADDEARARLNAIVHPAIAALAVARLNALKNRKDIPLIVYEAPLLFEAHAEKRVDRVLVVKIAAEKQLQRLMARDGLSESAARQRMAAQMAQEEKVKQADYVIDNSEEFEKTQEQVARLWKRLLEEYAS
ncbi:MAG: dephospho-CoA kinase [Desulfuromonadales bacterium]|nr:dephospho-CoA kinase [Desulfuromonadales bacterium]MBN2790931.1 dephospho-CoA kinase [Desulfuromonadales bacterium]